VSVPEMTGVGTLLGEVEVRYGKSGKPWGTARMAAQEWKKGAAGKWESVDHYYDLIMFGTMAENCASSLTRGMRVVVWGRLHHERWEKDGVKRSGYKLFVDDIAPALSRASATVERNADAPEWA